MRILVILITITLISACASAPSQIQYFLLDNSVSDTLTDKKPLADQKIVLSKLQLASYLHNVNLPLLQHNHGVVYANQSAWAEPLEQGIKRALITDFNHLSHYQLVLDSMPNSQDSDFQLQIAIDHFSATDNSEVILVGAYWLSQGKTVISEQAFNLKHVLEQDGFSHSVSQQRKLLTTLTQRIIKDPALNHVE